MLNFHDHRPEGLGVIDFRSLLSGFAYALCRFKRLMCLTWLTLELACGVYNKVVHGVLRFLKSLEPPCCES